MGTKQTARPRAPLRKPRNEKLLKVPAEVHQRIKIKAAQEDKTMSRFIDERTRD